MKGLTDEVIGDVRPIEVGGVNVIHTTGNGLAQYRECRRMIFGWTEDTGARELHRTIAEATHAAVAELEGVEFVVAKHV
jgi:hypothetical protein